VFLVDWQPARVERAGVLAAKAGLAVSQVLMRVGRVPSILQLPSVQKSRGGIFAVLQRRATSMPL
jgi:hypothetical protein